MKLFPNFTRRHLITHTKTEGLCNSNTETHTSRSLFSHSIAIRYDTVKCKQSVEHLLAAQNLTDTYTFVDPPRVIKILFV